LSDVKEPKFNLSNSVSDKGISTVQDYNKNVLKISETEIKEHERFLKVELKKNFY